MYEQENKILSPLLIEGFKTIPLASTPTNPDSGLVQMYQKIDGNWYWLDSDGNETAFGSGGGGGSSLTVQKDGSNITTNTSTLNYTTQNFSVSNVSGVATFSLGSDLVISGSIGVGTGGTAGQAFHVANGNILIDGVGENGIIIKRTGTIGTGSHVNPVFTMGRIVGGGIGEPKLRWTYSDDNIYTTEVVPFEIEPSGTAASVRTVAGSHFEGFIAGESEPLFRISSDIGGFSGLELGAGGASATDVHLRRSGANTMLLALGGGTKQIWYPDSVFKPAYITDAYEKTPAVPSTPSGDVIKLYNFNNKLHELDNTGKQYEISNNRIKINQTSHGLSNLKSIYFNGTNWVFANANSANTLGMGIVVQSIDADNFVVGLSGKYDIQSHGLDVGDYYYTSTDGSGSLVKSNVYSTNPVLFVDSANSVIVFPHSRMHNSNSGGGLILVGEHVLSSAQNFLQVTGLDLDNDRSYIGDYMLNFDGSGSTLCYVNYNDDTVMTGYVRDTSFSNNSVFADGITDSSNIRAGDFSVVNGRRLNNDNFPATFIRSISNNSGIGNLQDIYKGLGTSNLTKFTLRSNNINFGAGSFLRVFKKI